jgi:hypothetical protein
MAGPHSSAEAQHPTFAYSNRDVGTPAFRSAESRSGSSNTSRPLHRRIHRPRSTWNASSKAAGLADTSTAQTAHHAPESRGSSRNWSRRFSPPPRTHPHSSRREVSADRRQSAPQAALARSALPAETRHRRPRPADVRNAATPSRHRKSQPAQKQTPKRTAPTVLSTVHTKRLANYVGSPSGEASFVPGLGCRPHLPRRQPAMNVLIQKRGSAHGSVYGSDQP